VYSVDQLVHEKDTLLTLLPCEDLDDTLSYTIISRKSLLNNLDTLRFIKENNMSITLHPGEILSLKNLGQYVHLINQPKGYKNKVFLRLIRSNQPLRGDITKELSQLRAINTLAKKTDIETGWSPNFGDLSINKV
jgi:hypothetical protein